MGRRWQMRPPRPAPAQQAAPPGPPAAAQPPSTHRQLTLLMACTQRIRPSLSSCESGSRARPAWYVSTALSYSCVCGGGAGERRVGEGRRAEARRRVAGNAAQLAAGSSACPAGGTAARAPWQRTAGGPCGCSPLQTRAPGGCTRPRPSGLQVCVGRQRAAVGPCAANWQPPIAATAAAQPPTASRPRAAPPSTRRPPRPPSFSAPSLV